MTDPSESPARDSPARRQWLQQVLGFSLSGAASAGQSPPVASRNTADYVKARLAWDSARKHLRGRLAELKSVIVEQSSNEPDFEEIRANVWKLDATLEALDERLLDKLDEVTNEADPARRTRLVKEARGITLGYRAFATSNPLMCELDDNPFVPLDAKRTIDATLAELLRQL